MDIARYAATSHRNCLSRSAVRNARHPPCPDAVLAGADPRSRAMPATPTSMATSIPTARTTPIRW
ncbi:hypothetical protein PSN01_03678 [Micromonospora saelicesensis]|nr:hypothetical protein PSN01_03678 [Micromonospora saelicesensis]